MLASSGYIWFVAALGIPLCFALEGILVSSRKSEKTDPVATTAVVFGIATLLMFVIVWITDSFVSFNYPVGRFEIAIMTFGIVESVGSIVLIILIRSAGSSLYLRVKNHIQLRWVESCGASYCSMNPYRSPVLLVFPWRLLAYIWSHNDPKRKRC